VITYILTSYQSLVQKCKLANLCGANSIAKIDYCNAAFTSQASTKV